MSASAAAPAECPTYDEEYPGTAVARLRAVQERVKIIDEDGSLNGRWEDVRRRILWAGGLRDLPHSRPGQGYTGHSFNDWNHVDLTTMLDDTRDNENDGAVKGIAAGNRLGQGIRVASLPELGPGGSWSTCAMGCNKDPPSDVAHVQFRSRIAFKLVWVPNKDYDTFVLVDDAESPRLCMCTSFSALTANRKPSDEGILLAKGKPSDGPAGLPALRERQMNYQIMMGSKYAVAADRIARLEIPPKIAVIAVIAGTNSRVVYGRAESTPFHFRAIGMDGHPPQQSSDDTPPPDDRLDEDAPAATDASSTARTAPRRGRRKGWRKDKGKDTSSTRDPPRRSKRMSRGAGGRSAESTGSSGGGESIRDSAHDRPRGDEIRTGESYFQRRGSRAPRDNEEEEPPRQRQKVQWSYVDGSTYVGEALDGKRDGQGTLIRHGGVWDGVFKNGKFEEGTATNVKWNDDCRYTGLIVGGKLNGTGKITFADGGEFEGTFVDNRQNKGMAKNIRLAV
ncbi:hypothetical protein THAOC_29997 [Thalassiosira oceanica]|uniref:Uncharacterized protein n=1 Tax=Thalassiosira oceanica TaxID=159749 RepID=K0RPR6_THAOC|nr:hypothetical protein THAOC_29997 [Thalassiosira oceanica]|eukprot:EJK50891.1 hypothetical protein THAOC_29997 [Thalassiosira oceanica]